MFCGYGKLVHNKCSHKVTRLSADKNKKQTVNKPEKYFG